VSAGGASRSGTLPETQVEAMFDRIARVYDRMNSVMTAGMHHRWRRRAVDLARVGPGSRVLDVATGTGDLAVELAGRGADVVGMDFSEGMLELAREKAPQVLFEQGNALDLAYADGEFDAVTVGFGARNFADLDRGLAEMARVTRPGGRLVVCEFSTPTNRVFATAYKEYLMQALPRIASAVSSNPDAYVYLAESIRAWPDQAELARRISDAGWSAVRWRNLTGGIVALHRGYAA